MSEGVNIVGFMMGFMSLINKARRAHLAPFLSGKVVRQPVEFASATRRTTHVEDHVANGVGTHREIRPTFRGASPEAELTARGETSAYADAPGIRARGGRCRRGTATIRASVIRGARPVHIEACANRDGTGVESSFRSFTGYGRRPPTAALCDREARGTGIAFVPEGWGGYFGGRGVGG